MNRNIFKFNAAGIIALFLMLPLSAQQKESISLDLSLKQAIEYALENNYTIKNAELEIESAKKEVWKTAAIGLPQANAAYDYTHLPGELPKFMFPSPDGGMQEVTLGVKNSATYNLTVSQLVFSGEYIVGLQASRTFLQLSQNSFEKSSIDTREAVSNSYYTILILEKNKSILDSSLINLDKTLAETKAMVEAGFMSTIDYDQLRITRNTIANSANVVQRQIEVSYLLMKLTLGLGSEDKISLNESLDNILLTLNFNNLLQTEFNISRNIDYRILDTQEKISELSLKREKSKFLPTVSAFYLYQDKTRRADFDITFNNILGVSVAVPIFSSGQRLASVRQAGIELEKNRNLKEQVGESLFLAVEQARYDYKSAWEKYGIEQENIALAARVYDETLIKFRNGVSSSLDVTQANNQFLNSNASFTQAALEMLIAKTALEKALNNL